MTKTDALDLLGIICLALFAYAIWPPAALLVIGFAALATSRAEELGDAIAQRKSRGDS